MRRPFMMRPRKSKKTLNEGSPTPFLNSLWSPHLRLLLFAVSLSFMAACATSEPLKIEPISMKEDPREQLSLMKADLEAARRERVDKMSPIWYERAEDSYEQASELQSEGGGGFGQVFTHLERAHAELRRAKDLALLGQTILTPVIEARQAALEAGANASTKGFADAERDYFDLANLIERGRVEKAKEKSPSVTTAFREAELNAITDRALNPARQALLEARKQNGEKYSPQSYADAKQRIAEAAEAISKDRYNNELISTQGAEALFMAQRAVVMAAETARIRRDDPEQTAARLEAVNSRIASQLDIADLRNQSFGAQTETILQTIETRQAAGQRLRSQVSSLKAETKDLQSQTEETQEVDRWLSSLTQTFSPDEAEIYRQGDKVIFRLRGAEFGVGQTEPSPSSLALLNKVTESLKGMDYRKIVIEGHTDATGNAKLNDQLSRLRALAVSKYLVSQGVVPPEEVDVKGYGYRKPIATNKTREGRRLNRRIDVVVDLVAEAR